MEEAEKENILKGFHEKLISGQKDLDPDIAQAVNDHFWELIDGTQDSSETERSS